MDELKPDLQEVWEYLRRNPQLAISGALILGGLRASPFKVFARQTW
jgi:hypothetical protein